LSGSEGENNEINIPSQWQIKKNYQQQNGKHCSAH
jgi:hypothetical protein